MIYKNQALKEIIFPLGGIGSGSIGLTGNGCLVDWEIFNRPHKGRVNEYSCFAIKAEYPDGTADTRILQGDWPKALMGEYAQRRYVGYGFGPDRTLMCGFPHFRKVTFDGSFPIATLTFQDDTFPAKVIMKAFNPFIPLDAFNSSLPAAFFDITVKSNREDVKYTVVLSIQNPFAATSNEKLPSRRYTAVRMRHAGVAPAAKEYGDLTVAVDQSDGLCQQYWYRGQWQDKVTTFWHDLTVGPFRDRSYEAPGVGDLCSVGACATVGKGKKHSFRFALTWNVPNNYNYWDPCKDEAGKDVLWKNYYATQFADSAASCFYCLKHWPMLYRKTDAFRRALHGSTLDSAVIDAVSSTLSVLKTPTVLRLEDGSFYGWEGTHELEGSCEGTCTHVWSYAYALCFLFPELERSLRDTEFTYNTEKSGRMYFRTALPLGRGYVVQPPCVDGQMATVIKIYRDWKITGNTAWLRDNWDNVKKILDFAWSEENTFAWDRDHDGVLEGRQHHTLDMELFGPSSWLQGMYLAALKAASEMAAYLEDTQKQAEYTKLFESGYAFMKDNLFNGEYFFHKVDLQNKDYITQFDCPEYWNEEHDQLKYQIGQGSEIDQMLGQWHANICGLGDIFDPDQRKTALQSMWRYNFKPSMRPIANMWRIFALNDEAGTIICDYPEGSEKPVIPISYCEECMTGFEYAFAGLLISEGFIEEGLTAVRAIRDRYDGIKRNPYNEFECGNNYARPMASFALLPIFSGMEYDLPKGHVGFSPILEGDFRCFWSLGTGWGAFERKTACSRILLYGGSLTLQSLKLGGCAEAQAIFVDGNPVPGFRQAGDTLCFESVTATKTIEIYF